MAPSGLPESAAFRGLLSPTPIVDAHHHVWDTATCPHPWLTEYPGLGHRYRLSEFVAAARSVPLAGSVLVQAAGDEAESAALLASAAHEPFVTGVVGFVDLTRERVAGRIDKQRQGPGGELLVGLRQPLDPAGGASSASLLSGLETSLAQGLVFELLVRDFQLPMALEVARQFPAASLVLDHGGKPDIAAHAWQPWADHIAELSSYPGVACKLSGLIQQAGPNWTAETIRPYFAHLVDCFGPNRLLFGSDWPVSSLGAAYDEVVETANFTTPAPRRRRSPGQGAGRQRRRPLPASAARSRHPPMSRARTGPGLAGIAEGRSWGRQPDPVSAAVGRTQEGCAGPVRAARRAEHPALVVGNEGVGRRLKAGGSRHPGADRRRRGRGRWGPRSTGPGWGRRQLGSRGRRSRGGRGRGVRGRRV